MYTYHFVLGDAEVGPVKVHVAVDAPDESHARMWLAEEKYRIVAVTMRHDTAETAQFIGKAG